MDFIPISYYLEIDTSVFDEAIESPISIEGLDDTQIKEKYEEIIEKRTMFENISQYTVINMEVYFYNSHIRGEKYNFINPHQNSIRGNVLRLLFFKVVPLDDNSKQLLVRYGASTLNKNYVPEFNKIIKEKENERLPLEFNGNIFLNEFILIFLRC